MKNLIISSKRKLSFLSPKSWRGIYEALKEQIPEPISVVDTWLVQYVLAPFIILTLTFSLRNQGIFSLDQSLTSPSVLGLKSTMERAAVSTLLSPMTISKTIETLPHAKVVMQRLQNFRRFRVEAEAEELILIKQGVENGDIFRTLNFDAYFPPFDDHLVEGKEVDGQIKVQPRKAMILIPGLCVDHSAYASIASRIAADGNLIVVVLSLEPFRLSAEYLLEVRELKRAIRSVTRIYHRRYGVENGRRIDWILAGHSYGGYGAMRLVKALTDFRRDEDDGDFSQKVVLWAAGNFKDFLTDLSQQSNIEAMVILGSNDNICNFTSKEELSCLISKLPPSGAIEVIDGATHNNFAHYPGNADINGVPSITREKQHELLSKTTLEFINR